MATRVGSSAAVTRRGFLSTAALSGAAIATGCATNPVSGRKELMFVTRDEEIRIDRQYARHQISSDYGEVRDPSVNAYVGEVGARIVGVCHRPDMPYSFRAVNASYVNAYAFPGGSIAATRGILLALEDEAQLAALIGHEAGHVNARHTARRMTTGMLAQLVVLAGVAVVASKDEDYAGLAAGLGGLGAGLLLARYSRADERQADELGMEYMVRSGYDPAGMVGLMEALCRQSEREPSALEVMFSTHPMSAERRETARNRLQRHRQAGVSGESGRERFMDRTASVRRQGEAIQAIQQGDKRMAAKDLAGAEGHYARALQRAPDDYEALLKRAVLDLRRSRFAESLAWAERARAVYPGEPQALHARGLAALRLRRFDLAHGDFEEYLRVLPGNAMTLYFDGFALEGLGRRPDAAQRYLAFLREVNEGEEAQHARRRLIEWGYLRPAAPG